MLQSPIARREFVVRALLLGSFALVALTIWNIADVLLLAFGSVLVAVVLTAIAERTARFAGLPYVAALASTLFALACAIVIVALLVGPTVIEQAAALQQSVPAALTSLSRWLGSDSVSDLLAQSGSASSLGNLVTRLFNWGATVMGAIASAALVLVGSVYLAAQPSIYRRAALTMVTPPLKPFAAAFLNNSAFALRRWLKGQLLAMALVGLLTGIGLWLLGVPSAIALAVIAAIAEFVPIFGPLFALVPALLMAAGLGWQTVLMVALLYLAVQQIEANLLTPLIAKRTVAVPPALGLYGVVAIGILFGPMGLLFGYPILIVAMVAFRSLRRLVARPKRVLTSSPLGAREHSRSSAAAGEGADKVLSDNPAE